MDAVEEAGAFSVVLECIPTELAQEITEVDILQRAVDKISVNARSAVVSDKTPGVLPAGTPKSVQAATSILSNPTA